jgi:hypothetical protein
LAGSITTNTKKRLSRHNNSYAWHLGWDMAIRFLNETTQYLIMKRQQAQLITANYKKVTYRLDRSTPGMLRKKDKPVVDVRLLAQR